MTTSRIRLTILLAAMAAAAAGCNNGSSSTTTVAPSAAATNELLFGNVQPPVNGVLQSSTNTFIVTQSGGTIDVTLTSAVETLPGGSLLPTVTMGLGVGLFVNGACTIIQNGYTPAQAASASQLHGDAVSAGNYCVQVSDVSSQLGPVSYAVNVNHY